MIRSASFTLALLLLANPIQAKDATVTYSDSHLTQYTTTDGNVYEFTDRPETEGQRVRLIITDEEVYVIEY